MSARDLCTNQKKLPVCKDAALQKPTWGVRTAQTPAPHLSQRPWPHLASVCRSGRHLVPLLNKLRPNLLCGGHCAEQWPTRCPGQKGPARGARTPEKKWINPRAGAVGEANSMLTVMVRFTWQLGWASGPRHLVVPDAAARLFWVQLTCKLVS